MFAFVVTELEMGIAWSDLEMIKIDVEAPITSID